MKHKYGYIPDVGDKRDMLMIPEPDGVLSKVDLRPSMPFPCFDQLSLGACTANATVGAITFDQAKQGLSIEMMSRLYLYYYSRKLEWSVETDSGAQLRDVMKAYNKFGICLEADWPYDITKFQDQPTSQDCADARTHRPLLYQRVNPTPTNFMRILSSGFPIIFGFTVYESFESDEVASTGIVPMPDFKNEAVEGGHAVLAVGYDRGTRQVICRNSWGTTWGLAGYFMLPFDYIFDNDLATDFWTIQQIQG